MSDRSRTVPATGRFGLTDPRAEDDLRAAGWWAADGPISGSEPALVGLSRSPDPDVALRGLSRLRIAADAGWAAINDNLHHDAGFRGRLISVLGTSTALTDYLSANPDQWRRLAEPQSQLPGRGARSQAPAGSNDPAAISAVPPSRFTEHLLSVVGADPTAGPPGTPDGARATVVGPDAVRALRLAYRGLLMQIAATDLGHVVEPILDEATYERITAELSDLADAGLRAALAVAVTETVGLTEPLTGQLAVIAMGKCGARELNYVSDVDVLFAAEGDLGQAAQLASSMMWVAGAAAFEVDAALRPEGKSGALVRTVDGHAAYYQRWARTWEFQALLKARPVAGDPELGRSYLNLVRPLVWTAADRDGFVTDVQAMRRRIEQHIPVNLVERELKLGRGGLRDVEFAVQLLQLVHGRSAESLRLSGTVEALAALADGGFVGRVDAAELGESYRFLRGIEHRLQLRKLRRTHVFPDSRDEAELRWLARACGIRPSRGRSAGAVLLSEFHRHGNRVRRLHEKLFYRPLLDAVARVPTQALRLTTDQAVARLAALGYAAPDGALRHIGALTGGVTRRAAIQGTLLPVLLELLADTPDPDGGLLAYRKLSESLAATPWYLRLLRDEGAVVERLATVLGTSKLVPDLMVRAPDALRLFAHTDELVGRDPAEVAKSLQAAVSRHADVNQAVTAARSLRRTELARVASADLLGLLDVPTVCTALSSVWAAVLRAALSAVLRVAIVQHGPPPARFAVIGLGRLGGSELGYGSDADVIFVCEPEPGVTDSAAVHWAGSVAEQLRKALASPNQDPPLLVDADLRPEGRQGPLVRTLDSYLAYYRNWSDIWEAQALLRARPLAGDADLGARFITAIEGVRYPTGGLSATQIREIRRIKARVDSERLPGGADPTTHTKLGRGGLADIEWTIQLLQLRNAHEIPELRTPSTMEGIAAAEAAGLLTASDAADLSAAWTLATKARNATMLVRGKAADQLPTSPRELAAVASAVSGHTVTDSGAFLDEYRRTTRHARAVVERVFYEYE
ncbi:MAG TPA: bifunctional [glutamine synthetase] adenylyltransferase/[glutamine synthetase]-adenylyl-L-tyrosine phosphorylase [Pseudonocardiaceae bacterium]|jgi:glutamate-ammonia-ligase adenylyltransferase|nr:bifunctional [glutamine synthetase] adenylyltransferase/[glutamine synthetase]-adenylyl-L-tyrosine phosphorylase [Pseudonocardiaceae bacterium]